MSSSAMLEVRLPQFGMGMTDGTILVWHKQSGDQIEKGEPLCDIEAAKTTVEFEAPESGTLGRVFVAVDENVPVNTIICEIDVAGALAGRAGPGESEPAGREVGLAVENDKAAEAVAAPPKASPLARRHADQQGIDLSAIAGSGSRGRIVRKDLHIDEPPALQIQIEPRARKAARELGINLGLVQGSGPGGRVVAEDVEAFAQRGKEPAPAVGASKPESSPQPTAATSAAGVREIAAAGGTEVPHNMMRRTIARRLTESKQQVPHFYVKASCRIDALLDLRRKINEGAKPKVSVNDFVIRAIALALQAIPDANVSWGEKAMRRYDEVDVAVAVATPRGLVTPIVRAVESKTIRQISAEVKDLAERGRQGKLKPEEYQGGNTSVSNLGMFGVEEFSAILNPPQSSIFAIGAGEERMIVVDGKPTVATMMNVVISVDHRAVDGAVAAQLLAAFKQLIETPATILA